MKSLFDKSNTSRYTYSVKKMIAETLVEWDEAKNQRNIEKHGISFETAALVFADEERIEYMISCTVRKKTGMWFSAVSREYSMSFIPCVMNTPG